MTRRPWFARSWRSTTVLPFLFLLLAPVACGFEARPSSVPEQLQQRAEEAPARYSLQIETGMHTATINRIDADAAGRFLVTGSDDKTVRIWDLASGQLLRTLRPPVGEGHQGKIFAVALSPDGELVAAGGWMGSEESEESIYLFDRSSGRLLRRLSGLPDAVLDLAFSPDGSRLAASLDSTGLRLFQMPEGQELSRDEKYKGGSNSVSFAADGRIVTTSEDGKLRLYDRDGHLLAKTSVSEEAEPFDAELSPDGRLIAVGSSGVPRVDVFDATHLRRLYSPDTQGTSYGLEQVAWSPDGTFLYAAGQSSDSGGIRRWADAGRGSFQDLAGPASTVMDLQALPGGRIAFGSAEPSWGVLDAAGNKVLAQAPGTMPLRELRDFLRASLDGGTIAYRNAEKHQAFFSISGRRLALDPLEGLHLESPHTSSQSLAVTDWRDTEEPRLAGRPLALDVDETSRSLAIAPDDQAFLLGTEWAVRSFDRKGAERWSVQAPNVAWGVTLTGDGRLAIAAFGDGTIRWYRADDGRELLAFFPAADGKRWVLWTPSGYYDISDGGEDLIGLLVNNGPDRETEFVSAWRFRDHFHKPKVIDLILDTLDEAEALRRAGIQPEAER